MSDADVSHAISHAIQIIQEKIRNAALRVERDLSSIRLVAATKTVSPVILDYAYASGVRIFGENRLQEAQEKIRTVGPREDLTWHFIGQMQRRKLKHIVGNFALLHSVESLDQAQDIDGLAERLGIRQSVLLEVNVGEEASKGGFTGEELDRDIGKLDRLSHLSIQGLMTLPPWKEDPEEIRPFFSRLRQLRDRLARQPWTNLHMIELSMGMSHDFEIAIEEGATMVRIGTAMFGDRN